MFCITCKQARWQLQPAEPTGHKLSHLNIRRQVRASLATAAAAALRYGQLESVAHGLFELLNKHEHIAAAIADIADFTSRRNHDNRVVRCAATICHIMDAPPNTERKCSLRSIDNAAAEATPSSAAWWYACDCPCNIFGSRVLMRHGQECMSLHTQAVELLRNVAGVEPAEYAAQMKNTASGVRGVGAFIAELADRCIRPCTPPVVEVVLSPGDPPCCHLSTQDLAFAPLRHYTPMQSMYAAH